MHVSYAGERLTPVTPGGFGCQAPSRRGERRQGRKRSEVAGVWCGRWLNKKIWVQRKVNPRCHIFMLLCQSFNEGTKLDVLDGWCVVPFWLKPLAPQHPFSPTLSGGEHGPEE